jgi:serine/threonine-protein kinase RsbW
VDRLHLAIDSSLSDVPLVGLAIHSACVYLGMDEIQASQMELCTVEAMTNAIRHAYHGRSGHRVSVAVSTGTKWVGIEVSDSGTPMSPEEEERLIHGHEPLDVDLIDRSFLAEGGRGLQIIHDLTDRVAYRRGRNLNILRFIKLLFPTKEG